MKLLAISTWNVWQKITTGIVSTVAAISAIYGAVVAVDNYVLSEAEAGELIEKQNLEALTRDLKDAQLEMEIIDVRLDYYESESDYRDLSQREKNDIVALQRERELWGRQVHYTACLVDPTRADKSTCALP